LRLRTKQSVEHCLGQPSVRPFPGQYHPDCDGLWMRIAVITIELLIDGKTYAGLGKTSDLLLGTADTFLNALATTAPDPLASTA